MRITLGILGLGLMVAAPMGAVADDGSWTLTGQGRTVMPLQSTQVRMVAETVAIRPVAVPSDSSRKDLLLPYYTWSAECMFTFENRSDTPADILMGFPDSWVKDDWRWEISKDQKVPPTHAIRDFEAWVDGEAVPVQPKAPDEAMRGKWTDISRVLCWNVHFGPGQIRKITNRYRFGGDQDRNNSGDESTRLEYVLRTGALWNGPIGSAEIRVYPGKEWHPGSWVLGMSDELASLLWRHAVLAPCGYEVEWEPEPCFIWRMKDLVPKEDIQVILVTAAFETLSLPAAAKAKADLRELRILKNTVFAAHGKDFKDPELRAHFQSVSVGPKSLGVTCRAVRPDQTQGLYPWDGCLLGKEYNYLRNHWYKPRAGFAESDLTKQEWEFIAAVDRMMAGSTPGAILPPSR